MGRPPPRIFKPKSIAELSDDSAELRNPFPSSSLIALETKETRGLCLDGGSEPANDFGTINTLTCDDGDTNQESIRSSHTRSAILPGSVPVFLTRDLRSLTVLSEVLEHNNITLGPFTRSLFAASSKIRSEAEVAALVSRAYQLIGHQERIPRRVLGKLCCSFANLRAFGIDGSLWVKLGSLALAEAAELDPGQLSQVSFAFSVVGIYRPHGLPEALLSRAVALSPIQPVETYMNILVSLSKIADRKSESWLLFEKIVRDFLSIREGYVPVPVLQKSLNAVNYKYTEAQFRRILRAFKS